MFRCFLYGFPIATAVLCRAILEAQLYDLSHRLDPNGTLKAEIEGSDPKKRPSYLKALIKRAAEKGLLEDGELLLGNWKNPHWAEHIIDAGNWAIHDLSKFEENCGGGKVANLLDVTRKAVIQLLAKK